MSYKFPMLVVNLNNKPHMFSKPKTYELFINYMENKGYSSNTFHFFSKSKKITNTNYNTILNEQNPLQLLFVRAKLLGGQRSGFPNFNDLWQSVTLNTFITVIASVCILVITMYLITQSLFLHKSVLQLINEVQFIPKIANQIHWNTEFLFLAITYFIYTLFPTLSILRHKATQCPSFQWPWKNLFFFALLPFAAVLALAYFQKRSKASDPSIIYILAVLVFFFSGYRINLAANKTLQNWETKNKNNTDNNTDIFMMSIKALIVYVLLRSALIAPLFFKSKINLGTINISSIFLLFFLYIIVSVGSTPAYVHSYLRYISSPFSKCA